MEKSDLKKCRYCQFYQNKIFFYKKIVQNVENFLQKRIDLTKTGESDIINCNYLEYAITMQFTQKALISKGQFHAAAAGCL